jgi:hypothetical protein
MKISLKNNYLLFFNKKLMIFALLNQFDMNQFNATVLKIMHFIFWLVFIGLCIKTGAIVVSFIVSLWVNSVGAKDLYMGLDLSSVMVLHRWHYIHIVSLLITVHVLKAYMAYIIIKIFMKFNVAKPFESGIQKQILKISYVAFSTGIVALISASYSKWLLKKGATIPVDWAANEILFFAGIIYIIALVFEKGTELQTEQDLTV